MRAPLIVASLSLLAGGCSSSHKGAIELTVTSAGTVRSVEKLRVTVANGGQTAVVSYDLPSAPVDISTATPQMVNLVFASGRSGAVHLTVEATGGAGVLATASGDAVLDAGKLSKLTIELPAPTVGDMAQPDLTVATTDGSVLPDLSSAADLTIAADLLSDLSISPDLTVLPDQSVVPDQSAVPDLSVLPDLVTLPDLLIKSVQFGPATTTTTNSQPIGMAVGQLDGTAPLDVAIIGYQSPFNAVVYANSGSATFTTAYTGPGHGMTATSITRQPSSIAVADFNNDGRTDMVTVTYTPSPDTNVFVYLRSGAGATFAAPVQYASVGRPFAVTTGRMNADIYPDIVVSGLDTGLLDVLLNNGSGGFSSAGQVSCGGVCRHAVVADFNMDGKQDVAVTNYQAKSVTVLLGNGTGGFSASNPFTVGMSPYGVTTADFNGDGSLDLAVSNQADSAVSILLGQGNGQFGAATSVTVGMSPQGMDTADFNADGLRDIAVANSGAGSISVLLGRGNGTFVLQNVSSVAGAYTVVARDMNGDGKPDLVANGMSSGVFGVNINNTP